MAVRVKVLTASLIVLGRYRTGPLEGHPSWKHVDADGIEGIGRRLPFLLEGETFKYGSEGHGDHKVAALFFQELIMLRGSCPLTGN